MPEANNLSSIVQNECRQQGSLENSVLSEFTESGMDAQAGPHLKSQQ